MRILTAAAATALGAALWFGPATYALEGSADATAVCAGLDKGPVGPPSSTAYPENAQFELSGNIATQRLTCTWTAVPWAYETGPVRAGSFAISHSAVNYAGLLLAAGGVTFWVREVRWRRHLREWVEGTRAHPPRG